MNHVRYPRSLFWATLGTAAAVALSLVYSLHLRSEQTSHSAVSGRLLLAAMQVSFDTGANAPYQYAITINVEGSRSFRMPVRFTHAGQSVSLEPAAAKRWMQDWIRDRAVDVARFGVLSPRAEPYLVIDTQSPQP